MGYSHYLTHTEVTKEVWSAILKDCRKLYKNMPQHTDTAGGSERTVSSIRKPTTGEHPHPGFHSGRGSDAYGT